MLIPKASTVMIPPNLGKYHPHNVAYSQYNIAYDNDTTMIRLKVREVGGS